MLTTDWTWDADASSRTSCRFKRISPDTFFSSTSFFAVSSPTTLGFIRSRRYRPSPKISLTPRRTRPTIIITTLIATAGLAPDLENRGGALRDWRGRDQHPRMAARRTRWRPVGSRRDPGIRATRPRVRASPLRGPHRRRWMKTPSLLSRACRRVRSTNRNEVGRCTDLRYERSTRRSLPSAVRHRPKGLSCPRINP